MPHKHAELIKELMTPYIEDPSKRAVGPSGCYYYRQDSCKTCVVGSAMIPEKRVHAEDLASIWTDYDKIKPLLQDKYKTLPKDTLDELQGLHDSSGYWNSTGLTESGKKTYNRILENN